MYGKLILQAFGQTFYVRSVSGAVNGTPIFRHHKRANVVIAMSAPARDNWLF